MARKRRRVFGSAYVALKKPTLSARVTQRQVARRVSGIGVVALPAIHIAGDAAVVVRDAAPAALALPGVEVAGRARITIRDAGSPVEVRMKNIVVSGTVRVGKG